MGKAENRIASEIGLKLVNNYDVTLFVNAVGFDAERKISYGLKKGSSDSIGWHSITITPEMVGQKVAVFTAIEVKKEDWHPPMKTNKRAFEHYNQQKNFIDQVLASGGFAGFAQSVEDAEFIVGGRFGL